MTLENISTFVINHVTSAAEIEMDKNDYLAQSIRWELIWCSACWCRCTCYRSRSCRHFDCRRRRFKCTRCQEFLMLLLINCQLLGNLFFALCFLLDHLFSHLFLLHRQQLLLSHSDGLFNGGNTDIRYGGQLLNGMPFQINFRQWFCIKLIALGIEILYKRKMFF